MSKNKLRAIAASDLIAILIVIFWRPNTYFLKAVDAAIVLIFICLSVWLIVQIIKNRKIQK
ncbi:hypothetical protein FP435_06830 [Lactobacillus sp. PV037]|uniref:hypothetical protein n=1 Tax=Lactobacillus sp. PV037 TaxID=2594496 RepID=UPI00223EFB31|nr:hypothetical protein [Lactobacillus sp. PV037]QNQ84152.1 hypothetical protein FP435_06830 [Lactobacillus sp. PV037]